VQLGARDPGTLVERGTSRSKDFVAIPCGIAS